jgi:hypothetical protein
MWVASRRQTLGAGSRGRFAGFNPVAGLQNRGEALNGWLGDTSSKRCDVELAVVFGEGANASCTGSVPLPRQETGERRGERVGVATDSSYHSTWSNNFRNLLPLRGLIDSTKATRP